MAKEAAVRLELRVSPRAPKRMGTNQDLNRKAKELVSKAVVEVSKAVEAETVEEAVEPVEAGVVVEVEATLPEVMVRPGSVTTVAWRAISRLTVPIHLLPLILMLIGVTRGVLLCSSQARGHIHISLSKHLNIPTL